MHEMGIILHLAKTLDQIAKDNNLSKIEQVTLQVGEVSGIMTDLFIDCYNYFKVQNTIIKDSSLVLETTKAITHCDNCNNDYETIKYGVICPYCNSSETWLIEGNECIIKEVIAE